jgi:hypothetical protein
MERRTRSDENSQASEAELAGLRGGLAQEVLHPSRRGCGQNDRACYPPHPYYKCMCQRFMSTGSSDLAKLLLTTA